MDKLTLTNGNKKFVGRKNATRNMNNEKAGPIVRVLREKQGQGTIVVLNGVFLYFTIWPCEIPLIQKCEKNFMI